MPSNEMIYSEGTGVVMVGLEGQLGQICVLNEDGTGYCYWPTQEEIDEMSEPRDLEPTE